MFSGGALSAAFLPLALAYFTTLHATTGQTLGKLVTGTRVESAAAHPPRWLHAAWRSLAEFAVLAALWLGNGPVTSLALQLLGRDDWRAIWHMVIVGTVLMLALHLVWWLADLIVMLADSSHRSIHDRLAGTWVVMVEPRDDGRPAEAHLPGSDSPFV